MNMIVSTAIAGASVPAAAINDPIFEAIEAHKAASAGVIAILEAHTALEIELPKEKRRSSVDVWEEKIIFSDDPRWIECERAVMQAWESETNTAVALLNIRPTTLAGVFALLQYANTADTDGETWPRDLLSDDGTKTRSWHYFLIEAVADVLANMPGAGRA